MAVRGTTDRNTRINATGNLTSNQKETLRVIAESNPQIVYATADHTVNTTMTLANHSELKFSVKQNRRYVIETVLLTLANGTDGIKVAYNTATDVTEGRIRWTYGVTAAADTAEFQTDFTSPSPTGRNAAVTKITGDGYLVAGADGTITLQTALHTDNNATSTVYKGSYIKVYEVA
jgi:hypothetical protein